MARKALSLPCINNSVPFNTLGFIALENPIIEPDYDAYISTEQGYAPPEASENTKVDLRPKGAHARAFS